MDELKELVSRRGFGLNSQIDDFAIKEMDEWIVRIDLDNPKHRKLVIKNLTDIFDKLYIKQWEQYIPNYEILDEHSYEDLKTMIWSVDITFNDITNKFECEINEDFLDGSYREKVFKESDNILELLSPSWTLRSKFMDGLSKEKEAKKLLKEIIKNIVNKSGLFEDLFKELPELFIAKG